MVAEIGGNSVSAVARKHNIAPSLLFRWKRELGSSGPASPGPTELQRDNQDGNPATIRMIKRLGWADGGRA